MRPLACLLPLLLAPAALAQPAPSAAALDLAVQSGTMAALAPLCGLRDEAWALDLRRAALMRATRTTRPDDPSLHAAPGRRMAESALSYAEDEALERFAQSVPSTTCTPLADDPALARADEEVRAFRTLKGTRPNS